jgi:outer membrane lipoprotein LolB
MAHNIMRTISLLAIAALILSACSGQATRPPSAAIDPNAPLEQQLASLQVWTATGKASLRNSNASESVSLIWQQSAHEARVVLSGPLGAGATRIHSDGTLLRINKGGSEKVIDISSREAIILNTGWDLPLQALPYWLKGLPYPALEMQDSEKDTSSGQLIALQQDDWVLDFQQFNHYGSLVLPSRLRLEKGDTRVLVVIREWKTGRNTGPGQ